MSSGKQSEMWVKFEQEYFQKKGFFIPDLDTMDLSQWNFLLQGMLRNAFTLGYECREREVYEGTDQPYKYPKKETPKQMLDRVKKGVKEYLNPTELIEPPPLPTESLICEQCGKQSPDVEITLDPYLLEICDEKVEVTVCDDCYCQRSEDI